MAANLDGLPPDRAADRDPTRDAEQARRAPTVLGPGWRRAAFFGAVVLAVLLGLALSYFAREAL